MLTNNPEYLLNQSQWKYASRYGLSTHKQKPYQKH